MHRTLALSSYTSQTLLPFCCTSAAKQKLPPLTLPLPHCRCLPTCLLPIPRTFCYAHYRAATTARRCRDRTTTADLEKAHSHGRHPGYQNYHIMDHIEWDNVENINLPGRTAIPRPRLLRPNVLKDRCAHFADDFALTGDPYMVQPFPRPVNIRGCTNHGHAARPCAKTVCSTPYLSSPLRHYPLKTTAVSDLAYVSADVSHSAQRVTSSVLTQRRMLCT